jgi:MFS family permease
MAGNNMTMEMPTQRRWLAPTYALTIFISAFLLFQIQPMISKAILPWFGGTPAVWTTCLLFFQSLLFAGYAYAHFSNTWLSRRGQAMVHIALIAIAIALLKALPTADQQPTGADDPTRAILVLLALTIGLPYFVLSATGPLLQAWFAESFPGRSPYRLYALSNVGSLIALISFPFLFEAMFDLPRQGSLWSAGFIVYGFLCFLVAWRLWRMVYAQGSTKVAEFAKNSGDTPNRLNSGESSYEDKNVQPPTSRPKALHYLLWLVLPAFASATLMATTNHVSTDVAVVPLLWIVPLTLYLLTFIIAFDRPSWYRPTLIAFLTLVAIYVTALCNKTGVGVVHLYDSGITGPTIRSIADMAHIPTTDAKGELVGPKVSLSFMTAIIANCFAMFGICFLCHGELARLKPTTRHLTAYYLMMSAGGALGGLAVSVIAPHVFSTIFEWKIAIFASAIGAIALILYALVGRALPREDQPAGPMPIMPWVALMVLLVPTSFALLDLVEYLQKSQKGVVFQHRNFFGTLTIREQNVEDPNSASRLLLNGTTIHGSQFMDAARRTQPTSYYSTQSGVGRVLDFFRRNRPPGGVRIGDVGLGAGTLAAYAFRGDFLTFFEINPAVIDMSTSGKWFTYIQDCRERGAHVDIKLGDARLTLEREVKTPNLPRYHVLVLDAFSGDAVPTHLLTIEAYECYLPRIATEAVDGADGALIVHTSNRYLNLTRVVRAAAEKLGLHAIEIHSPKVPEQQVNSAEWMVLTKNKQLIAELTQYETKPAASPKPPVLWTDARSSLFEILR